MDTILLVTDSSSDHADRVEKCLERVCAPYFRFNTDKLLTDISISAFSSNGRIDGTIHTHGRAINLRSISAVWWFGIEPPHSSFGLADPDAGRWVKNETVACLTTVLGSLNCYFMNHPDSIESAGNKLRQFAHAQSRGLRTPETIISNIKEDILSFSRRCTSLVFKTLSHPEREVDGSTQVVYTSRVSKKRLRGAENLHICLNLFQEEIRKDIEYRVTVVGNSVFPCEIHSQCSQRTSVDWRRYNLPDTPHYPAQLPAKVSAACIGITRDLNLNFSTIDLIRDKAGIYWFVELNPNGLWAWIEMLTGMPIGATIAETLLGQGCPAVT